jgi:hypothetical protein
MAKNASELDPTIAGDQLFLLLGQAWAGEGERELRDMMIRLVPFVSAMREIAMRDPEAVRRLWWQKLHEPGPFGISYLDPDGEGDARG